MAALGEFTVEALSELRLSEISKDWADQVWQSDFCEYCELPEVLVEDIRGRKFYCEPLKAVLRIIRQWSESEPDSQPLGFWAVLVENGMSHHSLVALLYAFINSCDKNSSIAWKMQSCVLAANAYILINEIPGSGAYRIFHPLLFQKAVDVLSWWPQKENFKAKRKPPKATGASRQRRKARRVNGQSAVSDDCISDDEEMDEYEDNGEDDNSGVYTCGSFDKRKMEKEIKNAMLLLISTRNERLVNKLTTILKILLDLSKYLESKSLKDSKETLEHVISLLVDLTRIEPILINQFGLDTDRAPMTDHKSLSKIAYKALEILSSPLHGDTGGTLRKIFRHLISNILSTYKNSSSPTNTSITQEKQLVKDTAVKFVCYIVEKGGEDTMPAVRVLIQHLCMKVPDQAEYRNSVGKAVVVILKCFSAENLNCILEWIKKYSKNSKIGYRVFALDLILQLLTSTSNATGSVSEDVEDEECSSISHIDLLQLIISRCSDKAPTVRAKALCHLAQCICSEDENITGAVKKLLTLPLMDGEMEAHSTPMAPGMEASPEYDVSAMIRRRVSDGKVLVRKAALQVLESIIRLNNDALCKKDLETLHDRTMDPALSVRKQAMVSITALLNENPESSMLQSIWLDAMLPLVMDRETTVEEKCLNTLEEVLLHNIVHESRSQSGDHRLAWKLLQVVAGPSGQELRHYFQKVCLNWAKQGKFSATKVKAIMSHSKTENASAAWLLLAEVSAFKPKLDYNVIIECWTDYSSSGSVKEELLCRVLKVIENLAADIPTSCKEDLIDKLQAQLSTYKCSPEVTVSNMNTLFQLCESLHQESDKINTWCSDLLKASESYLSSVILNPETGNVVDEEAIVKHLFTIGEVALLCPKNTNKRLFLVVQSMIITPAQENGHGATAPVSLQRCSVSLSPTVKAHAFITLGLGQKGYLTTALEELRSSGFISLGKLCLQNEVLAKDCIAALTKELETSQDPAVRNNITVVLCDLCVRYTNLVDRYIPNIARGLRDKEPLVRRQTLTLLTHLLQEDYVKWKGSLFFRFVTALVDEDVQIRKFADFCLVHLLLSRHPGMFHQHFIESIFHFNGYDQHKVYNQFYQTQREKELFSLKGRAKTNNRMSIYKFLLDHTTDEQRFQLTGKLCQEVLGGFVDGVTPLNEDAEDILKDALAILCSKNIKLSSTQVHAAEDLADDGDEAGAAIASARNKFLTQVVKKNMIENIIPIIIELKGMLEKERSPLLRDLMLCLKEIMKDYRSEVQDVLSADRQLANEIEFDLRKFEEEQKAQERQQRLDKARNSSVSNLPEEQAVSSKNSGTAQGSLPVVTSAATGDFVTPQLRSPGGSGSTDPRGSPARNLPSTPQGQRRGQSLATTALLNSARKAIDTAKKAALEHARQSARKKSLSRMEETLSKKKESEKPCEVETVSATAGVAQDKENTRDELNAKTTAMKEKLEFAHMNRAASTPQGDITHLSRISFCINTSSSTAPFSPIVNLVPVNLPTSYARGKKKITSKNKGGGIDVLCMPSPEQPTPKPRTWNINSPCQPQRSQRKSLRGKQNDSIANRTRSSRK